MINAEIQRLHYTVLKFELMGAWGMAQALRKILHDLVKENYEHIK